MMHKIFLLSSVLGLTACAQHQISTPPVQPVNTRTSQPAPKAAVAQVHQVRRGDTLYRIARTYRQKMARIAAWNNLKSPYLLFPGQRLLVSSPTSGATLRRSPAHPQKPTRQVSRRVLGARSTASYTAACQRNPYHWQWPTKGQLKPTLSPNGRRGLKIYGQKGQTVIAAAAGQILYSGIGVNGYSGHLIIIQHNQDWLSVYAHNQKSWVRQGQNVKAGQKIASMGHDKQGYAVLQFELACDEKTVAPQQFLPKG